MTSKKKKKKVIPFTEIRHLNTSQKRSSAHISVRIGGDISRSGYSDNYDIEISDCNEKICLHGSFSNLNSRINAIYKFDQIIETLTRAKDHMQLEFKRNKVRYK